MQKILQARTKKVYFQFVECSYILSNEQSEICTCSWRELALWKRTFLAPLTRLIILLIYKKKQAVLNPKIGCFFLQKHRFSFPKAIFNFVKITHLPDKPHLKENDFVKPHEACKINAFCEVNINRYKQM